MYKIKKPELMSPVGNWEMLKAAVDAGADAVYFGVKNFNMRANARNFATNDLIKITDYCHKNNVKAYLTLNIIIYEDELENVKEVLKAAKQANIDIVICWDLSVLKKAKELDLDVCISTQASVSNSSSANFYKDLGAKRVVLARECTLDQIKKIRSETNLEIEAFVHGAMCISVSGRCFLSHHLFDKSANRGECMQPCRRKYLVYDKEESGNSMLLGEDYIISAKDLCTINFIDKLIEAGIDSFKIEGRKRSPEYVFTVTKVYREAIDLYFKNKLTENKKKKLLEELGTVFNRGFSSGFYFGKPSSEDFAEARGSLATMRKEYIGKITNYFKKIKIASLKLDSGVLKVGDKILVQGEKTGSIKIKINNLRFNDQKIQSAIKGQEVSFRLDKKIRRNDKAYLIRQIS